MPEIVFLNPWDQRIGPNRYLAELLYHDRSLAASSVVVQPEPGAAAEEYASLGCQTQFWPEIELLHPHLVLRHWPRILERHSLGLRRICRRLSDINAKLLVSNAENLCIGGLASRLSGIPHIQIIHGLALQFHWGPWRRTVRTYLRLLETTSDRFVTVSPAVTRMLHQYGIRQDRITCISNGLSIRQVTEDASRPLPVAVSSLIRRHHPIIVSCGRISPIKGYDILIDALPAIRRHHPHVLCLIAGKPLSSRGIGDIASFNQRLHRKVELLDLKGNVFFLGEIDFVPSLLKAADIYVQPSRSESFCRSVAEALICAVPVVATAVGGLPEVIGSDGGLLVAPENSVELSAAVINLLDDPDLSQALTRAGRGRVIQRFDAASLVKDLRNLISKTTDSHRRPFRSSSSSQEPP